jgi:hypothetical protein
MNLNELQTLWNSPQNNPPSADRQQLAGQFVRQMIRRRHFQSIWLITTFAWLTVITVGAAWTFAAGYAMPRVEWGLFPLLLLPWIAAVYFLRSYLKSASATQGSLPVMDSFRAALQSNQAERTNLKLVAGLLALMVPSLALVMWQLQVMGKVSGREVVSMALFFGAALLVGLGGIALRYFGRLQPQRKCLETLLRELAD